jgi:hypothetical protein
LKALVRFAIVGILLETISVLGFIVIGKTDLADPGKYLVVAAFACAMIAFLVLSVMRLSMKDLVWLPIALSVGLVVVLQVLGYTFFPGLVKGIDPFSIAHVMKVATATILILGVHVTAIVLILAITKLLKL